MLLFVRQQQMPWATSCFMHPLILRAVFHNGLDPITSSRWTFQDEAKGCQQATCLQQVDFSKRMTVNCFIGLTSWLSGQKHQYQTLFRIILCFLEKLIWEPEMASSIPSGQGALACWIHGHQSQRWKSPLRCWKPCPTRQRQLFQLLCEFGHMSWVCKG